MATRNQDKNDKDNNAGSSQGGNSNRGFASMDPQRQREIAAEGGRAAHASGNAHEFTPEEAAAAGRKGGQASHSNRSDSDSSGGGQASGGIAKGSGSGQRGGSSEQHAQAGRQSHKNER